MGKVGTIIVSSLAVILVAAIIFFGFTPTGKGILVGYENEMKEVDEASYESRKQVEDTCRAMISSYKSDVDIWNMYKDSDNPNQRNYADAARIRAVKTANEYNEYVLKNSYVWKENVPSDIYMRLETNIE
jgi:hypothetical protein